MAFGNGVGKISADILDLPEGGWRRFGGSEIFVRTSCTGSPLVVVNGGPGFSHKYIYEAFKNYIFPRTLIFYDQLGAGRSYATGSVLHAGHLVSQLKDLILGLSADRATKIDLIAHSWGAFLVYNLLRNAVVADKIGQIVFIEPLPPDNLGFDAILANLFAKIPPDVIDHYNRLIESDPGNGLSAYRLILPYYFSNKSKTSLLSLNCFHADTMASVYDTLGEFDFGGDLSRLSEKIFLILGEDSFISVDNLPALNSGSNTRIIKGAGHYPFIEDPKAFFDIILDEGMWR